MEVLCRARKNRPQTRKMLEFESEKTSILTKIVRIKFHIKTESEAMGSKGW